MTASNLRWATPMVWVTAIERGGSPGRPPAQFVETSTDSNKGWLSHWDGTLQSIQEQLELRLTPTGNSDKDDAEKPLVIDLASPSQARLPLSVWVFENGPDSMNSMPLCKLLGCDATRETELSLDDLTPDVAADINQLATVTSKADEQLGDGDNVITKSWVDQRAQCRNQLLAFTGWVQFEIPAGYIVHEKTSTFIPTHHDYCLDGLRLENLTNFQPSLQQPRISVGKMRRPGWDVSPILEPTCLAHVSAGVKIAPFVLPTGSSNEVSLCAILRQLSQGHVWPKLQNTVWKTLLSRDRLGMPIDYFERVAIKAATATAGDIKLGSTRESVHFSSFQFSGSICFYVDEISTFLQLSSESFQNRNWNSGRLASQDLSVEDFQRIEAVLHLQGWDFLRVPTCYAELKFQDDVLSTVNGIAGCHSDTAFFFVYREHKNRDGEPGRIPCGILMTIVPTAADVASTTTTTTTTTSSRIEEPHVMGQLFDYLRLLRDQYGVQDAFAIVSTLDQWRICWLPESDKVAESAAGICEWGSLIQGAEWELPGPPKLAQYRKPPASNSLNSRAKRALVRKRQRQASPPSNPATAVLDEPETDAQLADKASSIGRSLSSASSVGSSADSGVAMSHSPTDAKLNITTTVDQDGQHRCLSASRIFHFGDPELPLAIASALIRMAFTTIHHSQEHADPTKEYPLVTSSSNSICWAKLPDGFKFCIRAVPNHHSEANDQRFYLLRLIAQGHDGCTWLAATPTGLGCVVKFLRELPISNRTYGLFMPDAHREAENWRKLWHLNSYAVRLANSPAIIMPYVYIVPPVRLREPAMVSQVYEMLCGIVRDRWHHNNAKVEHIALHRTMVGKTKMVMIDMTDSFLCHDISSSQVKYHLKKMILKLRERAVSHNLTFDFGPDYDTDMKLHDQGEPVPRWNIAYNKDGLI